jgi:hypothetical protein
MILAFSWKEWKPKELSVKIVTGHLEYKAGAPNFSANFMPICMIKPYPELIHSV